MAGVDYYTKEGDELDYLCWKQYPNRPQTPTVEQVLEANPGLARYGPVMPAGLIIHFPELALIKPKIIPVVKFWN